MRPLHLLAWSDPVHVPTRRRRDTPTSHTITGALASVFVLCLAMDIGAAPWFACVLSAATAVGAARIIDRYQQRRELDSPPPQENARNH